MKLVQALGKLEVCQVAVAKCKMLNVEEDRVADVDIKAVLRMELSKAGLGPALESLSSAIKSLTDYVATLAQSELESEVMAVYKFQDMPPKLDLVLELEVKKAVDRWREALREVAEQVESSMPENWKVRCIDTCDAEYIKSRILTKELVDAVGSDYAHASKWTEGIDALDVVKKGFDLHHSADLLKYCQLLADARSLVSCVLAYNCLFHRYPKQSSSERRQSWKDLKKKLRAKFGEAASLPAKVGDRLQAGISGK